MATSKSNNKTSSPVSPAAAAAVPDRQALMAQAATWQHILLDGPITFFPIRHHSPACARHLRNWIDQYQPATIIVEGPESFNRWLPCLTSDDCTAPIAILTTYGETTDPTGMRHSAFYPMCDYSPELVAIRQGTAAGARVVFADLEFEDKLRCRQQALKDGEESPNLLGVLLADESNLQHNRFIDQLVRRLGCRDFDELWDHLFEADTDAMSTGEFVSKLATYCHLSRETFDTGYLTNDATLAREAVMVRVIQREFKKLKQPNRQGSMLVVTGGFHTVALPLAMKSPMEVPAFDPLADSQAGSWLIRYSYDQLDALAGYSSGMPNPGFYDEIWQSEQDGDSEQTAGLKRGAAARLISTIARETRGQPIHHEASVTDSIAALQMLDRLADLRGHHVPTRCDLLDAVNSCMRKESVAGIDMLRNITNRILAGNRIGRVPAAAGQPPIIDDFRRLASAHRLPVDTIEPRQTSLELYRKPKHRPISFLFHQLGLLGVPYAQFDDGPDFIHGYRLEKLSELWRVAWSPATEARLAEMAMMGDTIAAAATNQIILLIGQLEEEGAARSAHSAVGLLIRTCRCGLHAHATRIIPAVQAHIAEDGAFDSIAAALGQLSLLASAREPLQANQLTQIEQVMEQCYLRAVHLIDTLATIPDEQLDASLDGMLAIRELLLGLQLESAHDAGEAFGHVRLAENLFFDGLMELIQKTGQPARSEVVGASVGILYSAGRISELQASDFVRQYLDAAMEDIGEPCGVIRGLMMSAREAFWRMDELLGNIDKLFRNWEDGRFNKALPHMRLAFSQLSPREVDLVAGRVAGLHHVEDIGPLSNPDITEDEVQLALKISELMKQSLGEDGLL